MEQLHENHRITRHPQMTPFIPHCTIRIAMTGIHARQVTLLIIIVDSQSSLVSIQSCPTGFNTAGIHQLQNHDRLNNSEILIK